MKRMGFCWWRRLGQRQDGIAGRLREQRAPFFDPRLAQTALHQVMQFGLPFARGGLAALKHGAWPACKLSLAEIDFDLGLLAPGYAGGTGHSLAQLAAHRSAALVAKMAAAHSC